MKFFKIPEGRGGQEIGNEEKDEKEKLLLTRLLRDLARTEIYTKIHTAFYKAFNINLSFVLLSCIN